MPSDFIPILIQLILIIGVGAAMLILTHLLGPKSKDPEKLGVYECGITPYGDVPVRFSIKFYLVAVLFVLFDIEAVFLYPWAVIFKRFLFTLGPSIFFEMITFIGILFIGLIYVWRRGALDWD